MKFRDGVVNCLRLTKLPKVNVDGVTARTGADFLFFVISFSIESLPGIEFRTQFQSFR